MAVTGALHHIGTFLLFAATILLIVTTITAPVVKNIAMLRVNLGSSQGGRVTAVNFGTFGYCVTQSQELTESSSGDFCTPSQVGYSPAEILGREDGTQFSDYARDTTRALTKVMILHPIATGVVFIAFLLSLGAGVVGSLLASLVAMLAFIVTVIVLITDFVMFSVIRNNVNDTNNNSEAFYGAGMWTLLAAAICTLLGTVIVFLTCCSGRLHERRTRRRTVKDPAYVSPAPATRRRRWF